MFLLDDVPWILDGGPAYAFEDYIRVFVCAGRRYFVALTLLLNDQISRKEPWSYHALNLLIQIVSALANFGVVRRTLMSDRLRDKFSNVADYLAVATAVIFVVHPLQTQSVTYVIQRCQSIMGMFQFREAIDAKADCWPAHFNLGLVLDSTGAYHDAAKHYGEAERLNPGNAQAKYFRANALNNGGLTFLAQGSLDEAEILFNDSFSADNTFWQAKYNLGLTMQCAKKWNEASETFNAVLRINPTYDPANAKLQEVLSRQKTK